MNPDYQQRLLDNNEQDTGSVAMTETSHTTEKLLHQNDSVDANVTGNDGYAGDDNGILISSHNYNETFSDLFSSSHMAPTQIYRHYRTIGEIRLYLEHFFINLTDGEKVACVLKPFSIIINIVYIFYKFLIQNLAESGVNTSFAKPNDDVLLDDAQNIAIWVEFIGLFILLALAFVFWRLERQPSVLDCIRLAGEWSSFKLIYYLRPSAIITLILDSKKNDIFRYQRSQQRLNSTLIKQLNQKLNNNDDEKDFIVALMKKLENYPQLKEFNDWGYDPLPILYSALKSVSALMFLFGLIVGVLAFIVTLTEISFVTEKDLLNWTFVEWCLILALINQFWSMINNDQRQLESIYQFLFIDCGTYPNRPTITRETQYKIMAMDATIKECLIKFHGIWGILTVLTFKSSVALKIVMKNPFEKPLHLQIQEKYANEVKNDPDNVENNIASNDNLVNSNSLLSGNTNNFSLPFRQSRVKLMKFQDLREMISNSKKNMPKPDPIAQAQYVCYKRDSIVYSSKIVLTWNGLEMMQNMFWKKLDAVVKFRLCVLFVCLQC